MHKKSFFDSIPVCIAAIGGTLLIIGTLYAVILRPAIQGEIEAKNASLSESVEYIKCELHAIMSPEQIQRAALFYENSKHERGK
jgi:hypothetical protein